MRQVPLFVLVTAILSTIGVTGAATADTVVRDLSERLAGEE